MLNAEHANFPRAGFFRRLGAMIYDLLLAVAVYMFSGAIGFGIFFGLTASGLVSMNGLALSMRYFGVKVAKPSGCAPGALRSSTQTAKI